MPHLISHTIFSPLSKVKVLCLILIILFGLGSTSFLTAQITADRAKLEKEKIAIQKYGKGGTSSGQMLGNILGKVLGKKKEKDKKKDKK